MRIIIAGAGAVGTHLAKLFSKEHHDITLIDESPERLEAPNSNLELLTICGQPSSISLLKSAEVDHADLFIGVTPDEAHNMTCCMLASKLGAKKTVARVDNYEYTLPANANKEEREWHDKGYSWQTRLWIDDMYMITIVQAEAYHVTGDKKYINRAAKEMVLYLDELQHKNGLFYHAPDVPYYWGRGDGWMAVGMTELLANLPESDPNRKRIMEGYLLMMNNLKKYVNRDGLWNQLIDQPDFWTETSGSAMFAYAMILGVQNGWLEKEEFAPVARRAWLGLCNYINDDDKLTEVCVGTGKKNSYQYYKDRPRIAGDYHGQAPMLWCAYALLNNAQNQQATDAKKK